MSENKITPAQIESKIVEEKYIIEGTMTICVLTLENGFTVLGKSACADPANFDAELGERIARQDAFSQIWPLEGYLLKQRLYEGR